MPYIVRFSCTFFGVSAGNCPGAQMLDNRSPQQLTGSEWGGIDDDEFHATFALTTSIHIEGFECKKLSNLKSSQQHYILRRMKM